MKSTRIPAFLFRISNQPKTVVSIMVFCIGVFITGCGFIGLQEYSIPVALFLLLDTVGVLLAMSVFYSLAKNRIDNTLNEHLKENRGKNPWERGGGGA